MTIEAIKKKTHTQFQHSLRLKTIENTENDENGKKNLSYTTKTSTNTETVSKTKNVK